MITSTTLNAIDPIVDMLYADRVSIIPHPSSMLAVACSASKSAAFQLPADSKESFIDAWVKDMEYCPLGSNEPVDVDGVKIIPRSVHSDTIDRGAEAIYLAASRTAQFVRDVLVKQVNATLTAINQLVEEAYRPVEEWEIVEASFLPIWEHPAVRQIVGECKMEDGVLPNLQSGRDYAVPVPPQDASIDEFLMTGHKSLDKVFFDTLNKIDMSTEALYKSVFGAGGRVGPDRHPLEMRNITLCQLLLVYMLEDNPWPGTGLSTLEWDNTMAILKNALSKAVAIYHETGSNSEQIGMLIQDIDYTKQRIYVESNVYSEWLDDSQSNCPEILIGLALVKQQGVYSSAQASDQSGTALKAWETYHAAKQAAVESNRLSILRTALLSALVTQLTETDADDLPPGKLRPTIVSELTDEVRNLTSADVQQMDQLLIRMICNHFYPHTGCYQFAIRFNHVAQSEPNASPSDWELKSIIEYITDFTSAQMVVGRV